MSDLKRPLKVFLCHSHMDREPVRALYTRLVNDGVDAWLDKEKLLPGQDWELEIRKAVRQADVVVVCLSKQFNQAGFRQKEVRLALDTAMEKPEGEIFIIPARLEECDNLESLRKWHWVDLYEDDGYEKFLRALYVRGDRIGAITYSLRKSDIEAERTRQISFLRSQAVKLENDLEWASALELYRQIKKLDAKAAGVEEKINELMRKTQAQQLDASKQIKRTQMFSGGAIAGIGMIALCCVFAFAGGGWYAWSSGLSGATPVETFSAGESVEGAATQPSVQTEAVISDPGMVSEDEMVLIPAGEFIMGSDLGDPDEKPIRSVYLDAYSIDVLEVTLGAYNECILANVCESSVDLRKYDFSDPAVALYPVVNVDWFNAKAYCEWRGKRLPTEAEWEKAARGPSGLNLPWGSADLDCTRANYDACGSNFKPVGSTLNGASPYGIYDLVGNVWEWVADYYGDYQASETINPTGPTTGDLRVIRGGSFAYDASFARPSIRYGFIPTDLEADVGFRCAMDAP